MRKVLIGFVIVVIFCCSVTILETGSGVIPNNDKVVIYYNYPLWPIRQVVLLTVCEKDDNGYYKSHGVYMLTKTLFKDAAVLVDTDNDGSVDEIFDGRFGSHWKKNDSGTKKLFEKANRKFNYYLINTHFDEHVKKELKNLN